MSPEPETPPVSLCRCLPCCCKPGEGHNDPRWIAYEQALDELEEAYGGSAS